MERGYGSQEGGSTYETNRYNTDPDGYGGTGGYGAEYRPTAGGPVGYGEPAGSNYSTTGGSVSGGYGSTETNRYGIDTSGFGSSYKSSSNGEPQGNNRYGSDYATTGGAGSGYGSNSTQTNRYGAGSFAATGSFGSRNYQGPGGGTGEMCTIPGSANGGSYGSTEAHLYGSTGGGYGESEAMRYVERQRDNKKSGCFSCLRSGN